METLEIIFNNLPKLIKAVSDIPFEDFDYEFSYRLDKTGKMGILSYYPSRFN